MKIRWHALSRTLVVVMLAALTGIGGASAPGLLRLFGQTEATVSLVGDTIAQSSPAAADFDGDGDKEIVVGGNDGVLFVLAYEDSSWSVVWSRQTALDLSAGSSCATTDRSRIVSAPAVANLDNSGGLEIVVSTGGMPPDGRNGGVLVYQYTGRTPSGDSFFFSLVPGWPRPKLDKEGGGPTGSDPDGCWDGIWSTPALGDLDGDGDLEVAVEGFDRHLWAWHHNGANVSGWPIYRYTDETDTVEGTDCLLRGGFSSPAMGDIDGDRLPEVVVGTNSPPWNCPGNWSSIDYRYGTVWAINGDSTNVPGWPVTTQNNVESSPALGDIDGDGYLEVVVGSGNSQEGGTGRRVYAWNGDGSTVGGWPSTGKVTAGDVGAVPALGDVDGDGDLEVIVGCGTEGGASCTTLYAWHGNGSTLWTWSAANNLPYSPVLADYDGDGNIEVLVTQRGTYDIQIVDHDGQQRDTSLSGPWMLRSPPLVDDVDNDNGLEVVVAAGADVRIIGVNGQADDELPWPMFQRDVRRTSQYPIPPRLGFADEIRVYHQEGSGNTATKLESIQNMGQGEFDWSISHGIAELTVVPSSGVVVDAVGIRLDIDVTSVATGAWQYLGQISVSGTSGGDPIVDSPQSADLYIFVGDIGRAYLPVVSRTLPN